MSDPSSPLPTKPVNINISFNISRKQVTQNINPNEQQGTLSIHNNQDELPSPNLKPKNNFYRAPKTPELIYTDRNNLTKEFQFIRPTEELKRKRKVKRNSGDCTVERTGQVLGYNNDLEKSAQRHKRGYSTSFVKKQSQQTVSKKKKSTTKGSDELNRQNRTVNLYQTTKDITSNKFNASKSLKGMISKMINSELSKRSLPLPVVGIKSKYSHSTSLTNKKVTAQKRSKKRGTRSQVLTKQKPLNMERNILIAEDLYQQASNPGQMLNRSDLFQKLNNFKSVQNSMLFFQAQKLQEQQQLQAYSQSKLLSLFNNKNKVQIRTDQSIQCIDEIHELQKHKFRDQFFSQTTEEDYLDLTKNHQTQQLLQTYITLLKEQYNNHEDTQQQYGRQSEDNKPFYQMLGISARKRTKSLSDEQTQRNIMQNRQDIVYDENYLNSSDLIRVDDLLMSPNHNNSKKSGENSQSKNLGNSQENTRIPSFMLIEQMISKQEIQDINQLSQIQEQNNNKRDDNNSYLTKQQILALRAQSNPSNPVTTKGGSLEQRQTEDEKLLIDEFKKNQIQKWSYLLEYIKRNANNESNTQDVLQHVYSYLSRAKVDLIRQGSLANQQQSLRNREQLTQRFNQLSQQQEPHPQQIQGKNPITHIIDSIQSIEHIEPIESVEHITPIETTKAEVNKYHSSSLKQRIKSQQQKQQQILKEQVLSFKDQYESDNDDNDIKFMNLSTIQSALKNRLKILHSKHHKELIKLQSSLQQQKISLQTYNQQKLTIQKWFKTETKQIHQVKKNIWKSYNEAKGILDKSHITAQISHQRAILTLQQKPSNGPKVLKQKSQKKNRKNPQKSSQIKHKNMMKCLSETYLKKGLISYKQIIQQQQKHLEAEQEKQRQNKKSTTLRRSKYENDYQDDEQAYDFGGKDLKQLNKLVDDQLINSQASYHENIVIGKQHPNKETNSPKQSGQAHPPSEHINLFTVNKQNHIHHNDFSPTMMHYEEISKNLGQDSFSDQASEQSFNYYPSSHDSQNHPYQYEQQKSVQGNSSAKSIDPSPDSLKQTQSPQAPSHINEFNFQEPPQSLPESTKPIKNKYQSLLQSKINNLTQDDREDIFEFLFLDLCIQLYQEPCYDNKIMATVHKFMQKQLEMGKRKKGIKTNLNVVKDYLKRFCGYVLRTNKKALANMNVPMGPTALQMLRYMHENDSEDLVDDSQTVTLIVPITVFDTFERSLLPTLEFDRYYDDQAKEHERINFLKNIIHIHNKAIFDALNEYLDQQRPFGIWGKPFPWKKSSSFSHQFSENQHQQKLKKSAQKVVEACSYVCGLLVDKEQSLIGNSKVSPAYIEQIREDRISRMLANDMIQNEERWVFYDDEETQVMVEVTNTIYHRLLMEIAGQIQILKSARQEVF